MIDAPEAEAGEAPLTAAEVESRGLRGKFLAWWHGVEIASAPVRQIVQTDDGDEWGELGKPTTRGWPVNRQTLIQDLFGEGMITPGGQAALVKMVARLPLDANKLVVEYGAGLGGLGLLVASKTGAKVLGLEGDDSLIKSANTLAFRRNLDGRASIRRMGDGFAQFKASSIDAVVAKEAFYTQPQKATLFSQLARALKPGGQLAFTDLFLGQNETGESLKQWIEKEPRTPRLVRSNDLEILLHKVGIEIDKGEDITDDYRNSLQESFERYTDRMESGDVHSKWKQWALSEGHHWRSRLDALNDGSLRVKRYQCHRSSEVRLADFMK